MSLTRDSGKHWAYQQEQKVKILGMPKTCWTKQVYLALSPYGTVVRIEIQPGALENTAYATFQPPPSGLPYQRIRVGGVLVRWEEVGPYVTTVASPVNAANQYYEFNILPANSIDFGVRIADMAMIAMCTVESHGRIQVNLNLKRKELDIQFPLETLETGNHMRKFRFRLPISLLSDIYKVSDTNTGQVALIIPFDSPPQFFVQKKEGDDSFSPKDKIWNDWDTWYRETDVIDDADRKTLKEFPVMNHKDKAIIDIGKP